jgi:gamma-glutamyl:cysteine ligase YbdK (ATP-grasp superfamily)
MVDNPVDELMTSQGIDYEAFERRVREEGDVVVDHLEAGTFDNPQSTIGLEYEFYAADAENGSIRRIHRSLLKFLGFEAELGLHNAEVTTGVHPATAAGFDAIAAEVEAKLSATDAWAAEHGVQLVSDGMWTIGPDDHSTSSYLSEATHEEGLTLAINVSNAVRYHGFASSERALNMQIDVPGVSLRADNSGPVSLTTSIQPHYQVERAADLPRHFNYALRVAGPLLALGVNSPLFPPDLYEETDRATVLEDAWVENRVPVYEQMMNPIDGPPKVRFPRDLDRVTDAIGRIVDDYVIVPASIEAGQRFDDAFVHLRHKHGSYWRWVRPVFDGGSRAAANARLEFRPIPGQPTLGDTMAFLAAFAGLMTALPAADHPVADLSWDRAKENFYAAARDGLDADVRWITADGESTDDLTRCLTDLLDAAADGLERRGLPPERAAAWLEPLRDRVRRGRTPAAWKRSQTAARLDAGASLTEAIHGMQRTYLDHQRETFVDGSFATWPDATRDA